MRDVRDLRPGSLSEISTLSCVNQTQPVTTTLTIESFTAKMIVSDFDLDPVAPGVQNVWIQSIGCATDAVVTFN